VSGCSPFTAGCRGDERREDIQLSKTLCGIDDVEVYPDGVTLCARLFGTRPRKLTLDQVKIEGGTRITNINVIAIDFEEHEDEGTCLRVTLDRTGDFSNYCLCLVDEDTGDKRQCSFVPLPEAPLVAKIPAGVDPRYACAEFRFHLDCPSNADCAPKPCVPDRPPPAAAIDYLTRDFAGFRQLLLNRLSVSMPNWRERHVPDALIAIIEAIAFVADRLSYELDAVTTEAYLATARRRISVRRHARLLDYPMHEGCNARAFLNLILTGAAEFKLQAAEVLFAAPGNGEDGFVPGLVPLASLDQSRIFEAVCCSADETITVRYAHNAISFYTWRNRECCLPRGTTRATLRDGGREDQGNERGRALKLKPGDILILEEICGTATGQPADADPTKRWPVRLIRIQKIVDPLDKTPLLEVEWGLEDALPFPLTLSAWTAPDAPEALRLAAGGRITLDPRAASAVVLPGGGITIEEDPRHGTARISKDGMLHYAANGDFEGADAIGLMVTTAAGKRVPFTIDFLVGDEPYCRLVATAVARGNVVLVDHGRTTIEGNEGWLVGRDLASECCRCDGTAADVVETAAELSITLEQWPVTHSCPPPCDPSLSATALLLQDPRKAVALAALDMADARSGDGFPGTFEWRAQGDLIASSPTDRHFVAEIDDWGRAELRFGDDACGARPPAGAHFQARYRVGNGTDGNVGRDTITAWASRSTALKGATIAVRNPLAASGGTEPEAIEDVRRRAPFAYGRVLERAITASDYASIAGSDLRLQGANCVFGWTGIGFSADVSLDPRSDFRSDPEIDGAALARIVAARRIGHDTLVELVQQIPLRIGARVCVGEAYLNSDVGAAVRALMSTGVLADGTLGWFHPDRLRFGQDVYASAILAAIQAVEGVTHVELTHFSRLDDVKPITIERLDRGVIAIGKNEIAQCDSDPNFPERGRFSLRLVGGR